MNFVSAQAHYFSRLYFCIERLWIGLAARRYIMTPVCVAVDGGLSCLLDVQDSQPVSHCKP